ERERAGLPSPSPLLILPGVQGQAPEAYRRREGNTLFIQCPYAAWTTGQQEKYWCLLQGNERCHEVLRVYSYRDTRQSQDGRIEIKDNEANRIVSVTMSGLKAEDSGTYFCAAPYSYSYPWLRMISLIVFRGEYLYPTQSQTLSGSHITPSPALPPLSPTAEQLPLVPPALLPAFPPTQGEKEPHSPAWSCWLPLPLP
uniref:Ig-like domain-containing protein n=1 Tax=Zonotrichia albicollis TaxID=44394 RepID=A0A8D2MBY0_ZONAL